MHLKNPNTKTSLGSVTSSQDPLPQLSFIAFHKVSKSSVMLDSLLFSILLLSLKQTREIGWWERQEDVGVGGVRTQCLKPDLVLPWNDWKITNCIPSVMKSCSAVMSPVITSPLCPKSEPWERCPSPTGPRPGPTPLSQDVVLPVTNEPSRLSQTHPDSCRVFGNTLIPLSLPSVYRWFKFDLLKKVSLPKGNYCACRFLIFKKWQDCDLQMSLLIVDYVESSSFILNMEAWTLFKASWLRFNLDLFKLSSKQNR